MHSELAFDPLPRSSLDAQALFVTQHLPVVRAKLADDDMSALTIILSAAGHEHDGWRRALAGDLAREYTPKRVNIVGGAAGDALTHTLIYLRDAPGVTGHYVQPHE
ncbi:MAG: Rossmann fold domain-containing protein [Erythrobacter sp.]